MVKRTVNFDAPDTYHLYYGDEAGHPGTILTFFPWPGVPRGRRGAGQATTVSFSVPETALGWWKQRLERLGVDVGSAQTRAAEDALALHDPDGLVVELVAHPEADPRPPWEAGPVPPEHAIRGLHSVTLTETGYEATAELLTGTLGFEVVEEDGERFRFATGDGGPGALVDVIFREPGGVLFEIATDPPGFTIDEPLPELGRELRLPPWLEPDRADIERVLPPLKAPDSAGNGPTDRGGTP